MDGGLPSDLASFKPTINGAAIEVRLCAEDPAHGFRPASGEWGRGGPGYACVWGVVSGG